MKEPEILGLQSDGFDGWQAIAQQLHALRELGYRRSVNPELTHEAGNLIRASKHAQQGRIQSMEIRGNRTIVHLSDGNSMILNGKYTIFEASKITGLSLVNNTIKFPS